MRKLSLLLAALYALVANAQPTISITGGVHQSTITPDIDIQPNMVSSAQTGRTGAHIGFVADIPFSARSHFYFQPGVIYSAKGAKTVLVLDSTQSDKRAAIITRHIDYIDIPLHLVYKIPLKGNTKFMLGGGPQASLFYNGSVQTATTDAFGQYTVKENNDLPVGKGNAQYQTLHFGVNALAGFDFGRIALTAQYSKGLTAFYQADHVDYKQATIGASLAINLGKLTKPQLPPADQDKDGITDDKDACPAQAGTTMTNGCPDRDNDGIADAGDHCPEVAGIAANNGCPVPDTDSDGINDKIDKCPGIAGTAKYGGCPIPDTDNDGMNDEEDKCPNVAGTKEYNGCPVPKVDTAVIEKVNLAARHIQFAYTKATLTAGSFKVLDEVADILAQDPHLKITIEGHTSTDGHDDINLKLSQERAASVKQYLMHKGIAPERIKAIGYGATRPLVKEVTEADRAKNRRVELILSY